MKWTVCIFTAALALIPLIRTRIAAAPPAGPAVEVVTTYELLPVFNVESHITSRVERWVNQASGVSRIESHSLQGISVVRLYFRPDISRDSALKQMHDLALGVMPNLPPGTMPPVVRPFDPANPPPVGLLILSGDGFKEVEMRNVAREKVHPELKKIPGVAPPVILGGKERVVRIFFDAAKLQARNLAALDVIKILERSNKDFRAKIASKEFLPVGGNPPEIKPDSKSPYADIDALMQKADWIIELPHDAKDLDKIGNLVIRSAAEGEVRLRDVAVLNEVAVPPTEIVRVNGRREICIPIYLSIGADAAAASKAVRAAIPHIQKSLPAKARLRFLLDQAHAARQMILLLRTPSGSLAEAEKLVAEVERFLNSNIPADQRTVVVSDIGHLGVSEKGIASGWNKGSREATIRVRLADKTTASAADMVARLRRQFAKEQRFASLTAWFQAGARAKPPIRILLAGKDLGALAMIADNVRAKAAGVSGAADVLLCESPATPAITIAIDREKAADLGLTPLDLARQAATALGAPPTQPLDLIRDEVTIPVKPNLNLDEALDSPVSSPKFKRPVPLRNLVQLKRSLVPAEITHVDLQRAINIWVNVEGRSAAEVAADIETRVKNLELPKGVTIKVIRD